jgi:hypothetical protein
MMTIGRSKKKHRFIGCIVPNILIVLLVENDMLNFIFGTIFGIMVATIGFNGVATIMNGLMFEIQKKTVELTRPTLPPPQQ